MKTRNKKIGIILSVALSLFTIEARAGREGHGGIAVVCRDANDKVTFAELLDIFEAKNDPQMNWKMRQYFSQDPRQTGSFGSLHAFKGKLEMIPISDIAQKLIYLDSKNLITRNFYDEAFQLGVDLFYYYTKVTKTVVYASLQKSVRQTLPSDFTPRLRKEGCPFEVAAYYDSNTGKTIIDTAISDAMSLESLSALYAHEALFWAARENWGVRTSDNIRPVIGLLFSDLLWSEKISKLKSSSEKIARVDSILGGNTYTNAKKELLFRNVGSTPRQLITITPEIKSLDQADFVMKMRSSPRGSESFLSQVDGISYSEKQRLEYFSGYLWLATDQTTISVYPGGVGTFTFYFPNLTQADLAVRPVVTISSNVTATPEVIYNAPLVAYERSGLVAKMKYQLRSISEAELTSVYGRSEEN